VSDCNERKSLITNLPISLETGASGESVELHIAVSTGTKAQILVQKYKY